MENHPNITEAAEAGLFGIPTTEQDSELIIIPVPWDVTTSYAAGANQGPAHIRQASPQIDLFDFDLNDQWKKGFHMLDIDSQWITLNSTLREPAEKIINAHEQGLPSTPELTNSLKQVNAASEKLNNWLYELTSNHLKAGKKVGVVGGDHSAPYGCIKAHLEHHPDQIGILHFDAHLDLRDSYQGFSHSHASIMNNVMQLNPQKLVQVGIRDFAQSEYEQSQSDDRINSFYDPILCERSFRGETFLSIVNEIISELPKKVYVSFDIDGLDPKLCPNTGTPVPGGLSFQQACFILQQTVKSGRDIVGFDLCEVARSMNNDEWNGNVGARILYKLCGWTTYEL